jgi:MFS family permease
MSEAKSSIPRRYVMVALLAMVNLSCYADRTNMGVALLSLPFSPDFSGLVLSAFFYGYLVTQIPGGYLTKSLGGKAVLLMGVAMWTICDGTTAFVANSSPYLLSACRIGMGLGEGVNFPCLHALNARWFPVSERTTLTTLVSSGMDIGTVLALIVSPIIANRLGWEWIFIIFALINCVWWVAFLALGAASPQTDKWISEEERDFLLRETDSAAHDTDVAVPWWSLLSNHACIAIFVSHICFNYGWYVLLSWLPKYFSQVLHVDLSKNSFLASVPYFCGFCGSLTGGRVSDWLIRNKYTSVGTTRKIMNTLSLVVPAVILMIVPHAEGLGAAIALLCVVLAFGRLSISGYWVNMLDVSPDFAAQLMGISNTVATIPGIVGNEITGHILATTGSWSTVFGIAAAINMFGAVFFLIFGSGEIAVSAPQRKILSQDAIDYSDRSEREKLVD